MDPLQKLLNYNKLSSWYICKTPLLKDLPITLNVEEQKSLMSLKTKACDIERKIEGRRRRKKEELLQACLFVEQKIQSLSKIDINDNYQLHQESLSSTSSTPKAGNSYHSHDGAEENKTHIEQEAENHIVQQMDELIDLKEQQEELDSWYEIEKIKLAAKYDQMRLENIQRQKSIIENSHDLLVMSVEKNTPIKNFQLGSDVSPLLFQESTASYGHTDSAHSSPNTSESSPSKSHSYNRQDAQQQQKVHFSITKISEEHYIKEQLTSSVHAGSIENKSPTQYPLRGNLETESDLALMRLSALADSPYYQDPQPSLAECSTTNAHKIHPVNKTPELQSNTQQNDQNAHENATRFAEPHCNDTGNHQSKHDSEGIGANRQSTDSLSSIRGCGSELLLKHYQSVDAKLRRKSRAMKFFRTPESKTKATLAKFTTDSTDMSPYSTNLSSYSTNNDDGINTHNNVFTSQVQEREEANTPRDSQALNNISNQINSSERINTPYPATIHTLASQSPFKVTPNQTQPQVNQHVDTPYPNMGDQPERTNQSTGAPLSKSTLHIPTNSINRSTSTPSLNRDSTAHISKQVQCTLSTPNMHDSQDSIGKTSTPHEAMRFTSPRQQFHHLSLIFGDELPRMDYCNEVYDQQQLSCNEQMDSTLFALYKGFLVRRLMKTRKVCEITKTIKDTRAFLSDIDKENRGKFNLADRQLRTSLLEEVSTKQGKLYDILTMPPSAQWTIIKKDRKQKKEKMMLPSNTRSSAMSDNKRPRTAPSTKKLSAASIKTMKRRQAQVDKIDNNNRPKTAPAQQTPVKQAVKKITQRPKSTGRGALKPIQSPHSPTMKKR